MFDRGNVNGHKDVQQFSVRLITNDGDEELVSLMSGNHRSIAGVLNGSDMFIEVEGNAGVSRMVAKSAVKSIEQIIAPRTDQLKRRLKQSTTFDPYEVLGVSRDADMATIRAAYRTKATEYHPDRYASLELPKEMAAYIDSMARRINMAWQEISKKKQAA